jgi:hypothetical protein
VTKTFCIVHILVASETAEHRLPQQANRRMAKPTHFEMAINRKTAASIGAALLSSFLARADEVIG